MADPSVSVKFVRAAVTAATGAEVTAVARVAGSVANEDFVVELEQQRRVVVKIGPHNELATEEWACRRLATAGVPVPPVVAFEPAGPRPQLSLLILGFVEGEPSGDPEVVGQVGRVFHEVHAIELPGWGPLSVAHNVTDSSTAHGRHGSWREAISAGLAGLPRLVDAGIVDHALADAALQAVVGGDTLDYTGPGVLLHRDLKVPHLLAEVSEEGSPRLTAVIDWGDASVGDPALDLARLSMAGPEVFDAFLDGYGVRSSPELQARLARYRILWDLTTLIGEYDAGGDWFDTYRDRIRHEVLALGAGDRSGAAEG